MSATPPPEAERPFRVLPALLMVVGAAVVALGVLLLSQSGLGGVHIAAIGGSLFLSGAISTRWAADRFDLSAADQRRWSLAFAALAGLLVALFVVINWATFEAGEPITEG